MEQWHQDSMFAAWLRANHGCTPAEWQEWDAEAKRLTLARFAERLSLRRVVREPRVNWVTVLLWLALVVVGIIAANDIAERL